jgi:hypothetical protein
VEVRLPHIAALALLCAAPAGADPADRLPDPRPERCIPFDPDLGESGMAAPDGLTYEQVRAALNGVIQTALYCPRPSGFDEVNLTFELTVGCDGVIANIDPVDSGGAPQDYVQCISDVVAKADFPGHDMEDGMHRALHHRR